MANVEHLQILSQGIEDWNRWREENPGVRPDLRRAILTMADLTEADLRSALMIRTDLSGAVIRDANLSDAILSGAVLSGSDLGNTNFSRANLHESTLIEANLSEAKLLRADLSDADLSGSYLTMADLSDAKLDGANLTRTRLIGTVFRAANLSNCRIHGASVWDVNLQGATQQDLIITDENEPVITVDNLEVAQFMYLLLHNEKIRDVIDTITSKVVLILGRFTPERKAVLDAIRDTLRKHNYLPVMFDFDRPDSRDSTETITTLAKLSRFIIVDITSPRSVPQELEAIVSHSPSTPIKPIISRRSREYGMFEHYRRYDWVLSTYRYRSIGHLLASLEDAVIAPAEAKAKELTELR